MSGLRRSEGARLRRRCGADRSAPHRDYRVGPEADSTDRYLPFRVAGGVRFVREEASAVRYPHVGSRVVSDLADCDGRSVPLCLRRGRRQFPDGGEGEVTCVDPERARNDATDTAAGERE